MIMKIGILTMQYRKNYGGILQAYALMKVISSMGHEVEHIDFRYNPKENIHWVNRFRNLVVSIPKAFGLRRPQKKFKANRELPQEHINAFARFKKDNIRYSRVVYNDSINDIVNDYDCIVVGSDQVWNNVEGSHLHFFFDFQPEFRGKKVAYAPCAVFSNTPWYNRRKLSRLLHSFDYIGVRDNTTAALVRNVSGLNPQVVLDPTCLYDFNEFANSSPIIEGDYIFAYILGSELKGGHKSIISKICEKYGNMKVIAAIIPDICTEVEKFADKVMYNAMPSEWINLIAHSRFVYTDSFHGCMFAMKFHKPFFAYYRDSNRASRLVDIKHTYHLSNIFQSGGDYQIIDVDYQKVDEILNEQKNKSLEFLKSSLK